MEASISMFEECLEKQIYVYLKTKQKTSELKGLKDTLNGLYHRITYEQRERGNLEAIFTNRSLPNYA